MKFKLTTLIQPSSHFGVPQQGVTVLPVEIKNVIGPSVDSLSGSIVGYGTLSKYRDDENALSVSLDFGTHQLSLRDNFAVIEVDAEDRRDAYNSSVTFIDEFLSHLSVSRGTLFSHIPYILEAEDGRLFPIPRPLQLIIVTTFDIDRLERDILALKDYFPLEDDRLARAMDYYGQATLIFQERSRITDVFSRHHTLMISSAFLNLWKAISSIVGEPGANSDYQKRYRSLGFEKHFFDERIEKVRKLRNEFDVAHYSLHTDDINQIEEAFGEAQQITLEVMRRYRDHLAAAS